MFGESKKIDTLSLEEKENILKNARSSFVHGIEHLVKYKKAKKHIKFAILHVFHTVELIVKAHIGEINKALLRPDIDKRNNKKSADISVLMNRMAEFSKTPFSTELIKKIDGLREKRNEIEHREFVLENEREMCEILFDVIDGMGVFSNKNLKEDLGLNLSPKLRNKLYEVKLELNPKFKNVIERINEIKKEIKDIQITECPYCLNNTVAYHKESKTRCFFCNKELFVLRCTNCDNLYLIRGVSSLEFEPRICPECTSKKLDEYDKIIEESEDPIEAFEKSIEEEKKHLPEEKFD